MIKCKKQKHSELHHLIKKFPENKIYRIIAKLNNKVSMNGVRTAR